MNSPAPVKPVNGLTSWANKMLKLTKSALPKTGNGVNVTHTPNGSVISAVQAENQNKWNTQYAYSGYDANKKYKRGTIVNITASFTESFWNGSTYESVDVPLGSYICVSNVPEYISPSDLTILNSNIPSAYSASFNDYIRKDNWMYSPIYPEPILNKENYTLTTSSNYQLNQYRFWTKLGGAAGGGLNYAGEWIANETYAEKDIVLVTPESTVSRVGVLDYTRGLTMSSSAATATSMPGYYLCTTGCSPTAITTGINSGSLGYFVPQQPQEAQARWQMLQPYPTQRYVIKQLNNKNYLTCRTWDGYHYGTQDVYVAKTKRAYILGSEVIEGTTITFTTGSTTADNNRTASDGVTSEAQVVFPRYVTGSFATSSLSYVSGSNTATEVGVIDAYVPFNGTGIFYSGSKQVYLQECLPHRVWARRYI